MNRLFVFERLPAYPRVLVQFGSWLGFFYVAFVYSVSLTALNSVPFIGFGYIVPTVISIVLLVFLLRRTKELGKKFFDQVVSGTMYFAIGGALLALSLYPLTEIFNPDMLSREREMMIGFLRETTDSEDELKDRIRLIEAFYSQPRFSLEQFTSFTTMGLVYSAVAAIFIRQKKPKDGESKEVVST